MKRAHRKQALHAVVERARAEQLARCKQDPQLTLERLINEILQQEKSRLAEEAPSRRAVRDRLFWRQVQSRFTKLDDSGREELLNEILTRYADEIMGGFQPALYAVASKVVPIGLGAMMKRLSPREYLRALGSRSLDENLQISGPVEHVKKLAERGTLIFTPNHVSHFDSVLLGYALHRCGLPPVTYGAGLNLFNNWLVSYLMTHLGAYTVDRKKRNPAYGSVLRNYVAHSLQLGYHNLFYPGGTRSRNGEMDRKLKLGLLGTGLAAYQQDLDQGEDGRPYFVVPCTLNYNLVLEANNLITDYLRKTGASQFVEIRRKVARPIRTLRFLRNLASLQSRIHLRLCQPMDLYGNPVDEHGVSRDPHGRAIDPESYLRHDGTRVADAQRDRTYTTELGERILEVFHRNNVVTSTNVVAFTLFHGLRAQHPRMDLYQFLRGGSATVPFVARTDFNARLEALMHRLRELQREGGIRIDPDIAEQHAQAVLEHAMRQFSTFHGKRVLLAEHDRLYSHKLKLLYYYANKLAHYELEEVVRA